MRKEEAVATREDGNNSRDRDDVNKAMRDPAVKRNKSVRKGDRLKSRSEIEAQKSAAQKRKNSI